MTRPASVSVVVPTRGGMAAGRAVGSLLAQTRLPDEVLVVENGGRIPPPLRAAWPALVKVLREDRPGVWYARNAAVAAATGEAVAFLDDDARAAPDWIERMLACFEETGACGVGGPALPDWEAPPPAFLLRSAKARSYLGIFALEGGRRALTGWRDFLIGTNFAFRAEVFRDERFMEIPWGRPTGGGDFEFSRRVARSRPVFYDPAVVVHHKVGPAKWRLAPLAARAFDYGLKKVAIGRPLSPRGAADLWGIDGFISVFSGLGFLYGLGLRWKAGRP